MNNPGFFVRYATFLKLIFITCILLMIYYQLTTGAGNQSLLTIWQENKAALRFPYLMGCLLLMPVNWYLEAVKFKILMAPHTNISIKSSLVCVLGGLAAGIATPGRIGEYAGRLFTSDPQHKTEVISATLLSSIAQNICNIAGGILFSYFFLKSALHVTYDHPFAFLAGVLIQITFLMLIYYNLPKLAHMIEKVLPAKIVSGISRKLKTLDVYNNDLLNKVIGFSGFRYMIYFIQYVMIIRFFNIDSALSNIAGNISGIYMIQTGIPLPAFLSIMARGEVAILVWSGIGVSSAIALAATFTLWFINLILPSLAGLVVLYCADLKRYLK